MAHQKYPPARTTRRNHQGMKLSLIACLDRNGAIGHQNRLLWHLPEDLHHFREITFGHPIIMGRKTYDSLPHGALPGRENIVLSHTRTTIEGCRVFPSLTEALHHLQGRDEEEVFVIGGESVYREALPRATHLYLTLVDKAAEKADAFFPQVNWNEWETTKKEKHIGFSFMEYHRKHP